MSLQSFIAFPREADTSCIKSRIDKSKMVKVKDLKGTKWEKDYFGLPDEMQVYLGDWDDLQNLDVYEKYPNAVFKKVFENPFIYSMNAEFKVFKPVPDKYMEESLKLMGIRMSKEEYVKHLEETGKEKRESDINYVGRCRKQLYDVIKFNTNSGEVVEIYSGWDSGMTLKDVKPGVTKEELDKITEKFFKKYKARFGPPKETRVLDVEEVLTSELLDLQAKVKIEIRNVE